MPFRLTWRTLSAVVAVSAGCSGTEPNRPAIARIVITPAADTVTVAEAPVLHATAKDAAGQPVGGRTFVWRSSDATIATVDALGALLPIRRGHVVVTAESDGVSGAANIEVRDPFIGIVLGRRFPSAFADDTTLLSLTAIDSVGLESTVTNARWSTANPSVADVDGHGVATARQVGRAVLRVVLGGSVDSTELAVVPRRIGPNRGLAFIYYPGLSASVEELWFNDGAATRRVSAPGREVFSFGWSRDGSILAISYTIPGSP